MKFWILGAGGQLGCALIDLCQHMRIPFVSSRHSDLDITNLEALRKKTEEISPTHILNCAAYTDVDGAEKESKKAFQVNAKGPENLGVLAREFPLKIVHVSTDYIFDGEKGSPYKEDDKPNPLGVYGKSKWEGEQRLLDQFSAACIVRTSWIFGRGGNNFISSVLSLLQKKTQIEAVEDQINRATYNRDLAKALVDLSSHSGVFHFANGGEVSRYQIVQDFFSEATSRGLLLSCQKIIPILYENYSLLSPRPRYSVLDTTKVEGVLGRKPRMWETVLEEYLDYVTRKP